MNNYVTTNIRLPEEDYLRLKQEAAKSRKSLSAVIREKIGVAKKTEVPSDEIIKKIRLHVAQGKGNLSNIDIVETLRAMRNQGKW